VPDAVSVFARHGIDTCCGGGLPVEEAARRHGVDVDDLLREVGKVAGG
jgi:regulator of cell morphogenesis and NO signaling